MHSHFPSDVLSPPSTKMPKKIRIMVALTHPTFCQPAAYSAWSRVPFGSLGLPQEDINEKEELKITLAHIFNRVTEYF